MKYKKYSYILVLILMLMIGINKTYAENKYEKMCYYVSSNNDFKATLELRSGYKNPMWHDLKSYALVYVDKNGEEVMHNKEKVNNWYGGLGSVFEDKTSKGWYKFETYYKNYKEANDDADPDCPKYIVFQACSVYKVFATEDQSLAQNAVNAINKEEKCKGYYAVSGYSAEQYYGSFAELDSGGTEAEIDCDTLFGDPKDDGEKNDIGNDGVASISYLINLVMSYVRIIVPILIILLGSLDFAKAVLASKEDVMRKAQITFFKRLIIGVCVFFAPLLVNVIMSLAEIVWEGLGYSSCNINL